MDRIKDVKLLTVGDIIAALSKYPNDTLACGQAGNVMSSIFSIQEARDSGDDTLLNISMHFWEPTINLEDGKPLGFVEPGSGANKKFIMYWIHGSYSVLSGASIEEAFSNSGYGAGAISAVDFYEQSNHPTYSWNPESKTWQK